MSTYDLKFVADVEGVAKGLSKVPGMSEAAAAKAAMKQVEAGRKAAAQQEKDQKAAAEKAAGNWTKAFKKLSGVAGFGKGFVNDIDDINEGLDATGGSAARSAMLIAGIGAAAVGAAVGAVELQRGARDAINEIDRLKLGQYVTDEQREQVAAANDALDAIGVAAGVGKVALASLASEGIEAAAVKLVELELFASKVVGAFDVGALSINSWTSLLGAVVVGGITPFVDGLMTVHRFLGTNTDAMEGWAAGLHETGAALADNAFAVNADTEAQRAQLAVSTDAGRVIEQVAKSNEKSTERWKQHAEAVQKAKEAYRDQLAAMRELGAVGTQADADTLTAVQKVTAAYEEQLVAIEQKKEAALTAARKAGASEEELASIVEMAASSAQAADSAFLRARAKAHLEMANTVTSDQQRITEADRAEVEKRKAAHLEEQHHWTRGIRAVTEEDKAAREERLAGIDREVEKWSEIGAAVGPYLDGLGGIADSIGTMAGLAQDYHTERASSLQEEFQRLKKNHDASLKYVNSEGQTKAEWYKEKIAQERKAAKRAFRVGQAAAIGGAIMSGAQAYLAVMASPAVAASGPGAPGIAAAITIPPTLAQIATIAAQKPPEFARGGVVGIGAHEGEGIANRRAMATPGFAKALDEANEGRGDSGGETHNWYLNDRLIMTVYKRAKRLAGEPIPPALAGV